MARQMHTYVAFLRGINVGGKSLISMADLRRYFETLGYDSVGTYINSGNIVFRSTSTDERRMERSITKALVEHFGEELAVVVVSVDAIDLLLESIPRSWHKPAEEKRNVIFLRHTIDNPDILDGFKPKPKIESVRYVPRALLWSALKSDLTRSAMVKVSSSPLYKDMTIRTIGTVQKVQALMHKTESGD